ncbi:hypothetical protein ECANGB1_668 [Enterospora canceri]|uniref:Peptidase M12B domain-containing protein n=1 Tax=Enterospora canceri TaxID=1081671 RepID=A0A1Y1S7M7_9MICR|nr:hypothetical protein ECANGB1_668 [Enterospora canceri]
MIILFLSLISSISMRFVDEHGFDIPNIFKYSQFKILLDNSTAHSEPIELECVSSLYDTENSMGVSFTDDKCRFYVTGIKMGDTRITDGTFGSFNGCNRNLEYILDSIKYKYELHDDVYMLTTSDKYSKDEYPGIKYIGDMTDMDYLKENKVMDMNNLLQRGLIAAGLDGSVINFNVFVVKDPSVKDDEMNIDKILSGANEIFAGTGIRINTMDQININGGSVDDLEHFAQLMNEIKIKNDKILRASLIMLVKKSETKMKHLGMSYSGGADTLNKNYSVIYLRDSKSHFNQLLNARVVAHEIAHSMGVPHDKDDTNHVMSRVDFKASRSKKYLKFSTESLYYINKYYKKTQIRRTQTNTNRLVTSEADATALVNELRRDSYNQIVKERLNNKEPDTIRTKYYLVLSLLFYLFSIMVAVIYIK